MMMKIETLINQVIADHEQGRREYEEMATENAANRERVRASIAEKRERFEKRRKEKEKHFDFIRK